MFGISGEHLLVLLVILLIFGPKRLPDLGHSIGRTLKNFRDGLNAPQPETPSQATRDQLESRTGKESASLAGSQREAEASPRPSEKV